jgi:hypothetical protein
VGRFEANGIAFVKTKQRVEKAGAWKPAKMKNRFLPPPTLPWKSRRIRQIPTFPLHRPLLTFSNQRSGRLAPPQTETG